MKSRLLHWLVPRLIKAVIVFMSVTIRWRFIGDHPRDCSERYIYAFWHNRILMAVIGLSGRPGYMLISNHRDGKFIADTIHLFGVKSIRGSTTRGGARALLGMVRRFREEHCNFGITPDGPQGPREVVQPGVLQLARKTGLPVRPVAWATSRNWRVTSSWDYFYIPQPFSRGVYIYGEPVSISADEDNASALARIQAAIDAVCEQAEGEVS